MPEPCEQENGTHHMSNCHICNRLDTHTACTFCELKMKRLLADISEYLDIAANELTPGQATKGTGRGNEISIGVRVNALDFLAGNDVLPVLELWEKDFRDTYNLTPYGPASAARNAGKGSTAVIKGVIQFLTDTLPLACADHPAIADFNQELRQCHAQARAAARMEPATTMSITCPADLEDGTICGRRINVDTTNLHANARCKSCGSLWDVAHLMHVAIATPGAEVWTDGEAAAGYFKISDRVLRKWAQSGKIVRVGGQYELHSVYLQVEAVSA